jgi:hypothetical protein
MATFVLLAKYLAFLRAEGVYHNTRIILVADHGRGDSGLPANIPLPGGEKLQGYNPLLMVKDFTEPGGQREGMKTDHRFMTNADAPFFALEGLMTEPENPFTHRPLTPNKADGIGVVTIGALSSYRHGESTYTIPPDQWLHVHDDIFNPRNWGKASEQGRE